MKIARRTLIQSGLGTATSIGLSALCLSARAQSALRVAAFVPEQSFGVSRVIKPWMAAVEKDQPTKVKLQGFWGGTLGKDPFKQYELVKNGVADVAWVLPGYTPGQFPDLQAFELPALFRDAVEAGTVAWRLYEKNLLKGFDGVKAVTMFSTEPMSLWMRQPINSLEDLKNKKIRSPGAVHAKWLESFGASAETMDSPEMNEMLNRNTLDGALQGATGMKTYKSLALINQDYHLPLGVIPFLLLINEKTWSRQPDDVKAAMLKRGGEVSAIYGGKAYEEAGQQIQQELKAEGRVKTTTPSAAQLMTYEPRNQAVQQWWADKTPNGKTLMVEIQAQLKSLRSSS